MHVKDLNVFLPITDGLVNIKQETVMMDLHALSTLAITTEDVSTLILHLTNAHLMQNAKSTMIVNNMQSTITSRRNAKLHNAT